MINSNSKIKRFIRIIYRRIYDYPIKWNPYEWKKSEMTDEYWKGYNLSSTATNLKIDHIDIDI
jgi:hypothetical protein